MSDTAQILVLIAPALLHLAGATVIGGLMGPADSRERHDLHRIARAFAAGLGALVIGVQIVGAVRMGRANQH